jgi:hypothetical protein
MQKIATLIYQGIENEATITPAIPGGGQHLSNAGFSGGGMGGMVQGMAVKPQIGEAPAQAMLTGFYDSSEPNAQPHPEKMLISGNEVWEGPGASGWNANPETNVDTEVAALKTALEAAITAVLPGGVEFQIFRIDYSGVVYGDKGYHFPV